MKTITISIRSIYGVDTAYPACSVSVMFAALAGTKTLTAQALRIIRDNGYTINVEAPRVSFAA